MFDQQSAVALMPARATVDLAPRAPEKSMLAFHPPTLISSAWHGASSAFDTNQRAQARNTPRKPRVLGGLHHCAHILVGAGRLFRDPASGGAADNNALRASSSMIARPLQCLSAGCRHIARPAPWHADEKAFFSLISVPRMTGTRAHAAADQHGLATGRSASGKLGCPAQSACRTFAMDKKLPPLAVDIVLFDLTGVVRDVEKQAATRQCGRSAQRRAAQSGRGFRGWQARS